MIRYRQEIAVAWHVAMFQRAKKLPTLTKVLRNLEGKPAFERRQTVREQIEVARAIHAAAKGQR